MFKKYKIFLVIIRKKILFKVYLWDDAFEYRRAAKEARWDKMSKVFPKLAKAITVAAKMADVIQI